MDVTKILEKLSQLGYVRLNKIVGNYYSVYCPFHNNGNEKKPSCGVLLREEYRNGQRYPEGWWHCFSCGAAYTMPQAISEILKSRSISQSGLDWLKQNIPDFQEYEIDLLIPQDLMMATSNNFALNYIRSKQGQEVSYVSEEELASYRYTVPYMYERKLTDEIIEKYDIGVDLKWVPPGRNKPVPCITFPVRDKQGRTLFFCRRSIQGKLYNYPQGVTKPVYGIDMIPQGCKSVIIMESCINALTAEVYGYDAVALLGTGNSYQMKQLRELGVSEYVICTDGDDAGRRAAEKLKNALRSVALVWVMPMPDGKDANDLTKEEFDQIYSMRE